jgi:aminoglycoside phosphotransferase (APT) family kinase protein
VSEATDGAATAEGTVGGFEVARLGGWLADRCGLAATVTVHPVAGGRSNLTAVVIDARGRRVVVRRPPLSGVLASAHDVVREGRIMAALATTAVPVPAVLATADADDGPGTAILVTAHVDGTVVRDRALAATLAPAERSRLTGGVATTLATLHAVDIDVVGLGDLARRDGYLARQVARWTRQLEGGSDRKLPVLVELARVLTAGVPEQREVALVHGDYRLDNLIVDVATGEVRAVVDWELATLGDPLADLGTLLAYWGVPAAGDVPASVIHPDLPTASEGFARPAELVATYAAARGLEVDQVAARLRPFLAFAWFRIACILEGVRVRTASGAYGAVGEQGQAEVRLFETLVPALGERALAVLGRSGPLGFDHELT